MKVSKSAEALKNKGPWDVIVVGSGMGGMSCAAALAKTKKRVLLLEQHYIPGGFTQTFSRKGFVWDAGVHCIGEMGERGLPGKILRWLSNQQIEWKSLGPVYETFHFPSETQTKSNGKSASEFKIEFPDNYADFRRNLEERFPDEKEAIGNYFAMVRKVVRTVNVYFSLRLMPQAVDEVLSKTVFKDAIKLWARTTAEVLDEMTSNSKLKAVLTAQWGYYGSTPSKSSFGIHALVVQHYLRGGYYPVKGSHVFAESLVNVIAEAGGETCVRTPVKEIIIKNEKAIGVRTVAGDEFFAPKIVSAVGAHTTLNHLVPKEYSMTPWGKGIQSLGHSPSYLCLNIGFEGDVLAAGATSSNQWFFESWDMEISDWEVSDPNALVPVIYFSFPSLKDPAHQPGPKQRHTGEAITFLPWDVFKKWENTRRGNRDPEYLAFKKTLEERFLAQLRKRLPKVMELMVYHELSTPLSTAFFTRAPQGALYGLEATPRRFTSPHLRTRTPIKNLYMAGSDIASMGVSGALVGGLMAAGTIEPKVWLGAFKAAVKKPLQ